MKTRKVLCGLLAVMSALVFFACKDVESAARSALTGTISLDNNSPQAGRTITATYAPGNGSGAQTWQWFRVGTTEDSISGATSNTYAVTAADAGKKIKAQVSFADQDGAVSRTTNNAVPGGPPPAAAKILVAITLNTDSVKTTYNKGETLNLTGLVVTALYDNTTSAVVDGYISNPMHGDALITPGTSSVTITYAEGGVTRSDDFIVTVLDPSLPLLSGSITITPNTNVTTGTPLTASYQPGTGESVSVSYQWHRDGTNVGTGSTITPTTAGSYTVTVSAPGYNPKTSTAVHVSLPDLSGSITISPTTAVINTQLTAHYSGSESGVSYQWHMNDGNVGSGGTTFTPTVAGNYSVTVSASGYNPKTSNAVTVTDPGTVPKTLSSISLTGPTKTTYTSGEPLNLAGLVVTAHYSDGTTAIVSSYTTSLTNGAVITANTTVTVSYTEGGVTETKTFAVMIAGAGFTDPIEMVSISAGTFTMGSSDSGDYNSANGGQSAAPPHQVTLTQGFYMGKYEVTQKQWQDMMGSLPSQLTNANYGKGDNYPVYYVNFYGALAFCNRLSIAAGLAPAYSIMVNNTPTTDPDEWGAIPTTNRVEWNYVEVVSGSNGYRLPTEAQWEYACRAGTTTRWHTPSGTDSDLGSYAWYSVNSGGIAHEAGGKLPNAWGLYDMYGNVDEWCLDWYDVYTAEPQTDPVSFVRYNNHIVRGGNHTNTTLSSAYRGAMPYVYYTSQYVGFRIVRPQ
jgi:formylglycine-generating enzyme required for sulfatase activity